MAPHKEKTDAPLREPTGPYPAKYTRKNPLTDR